MPETIMNSEVLSEMNVEARTVLAFSVDENILDQLQWLPQGWRPVPPGAGPFKDANILVIFSDRLLVQDKDGKALPGQETNPLVIIAVLAQNAEIKDIQGVPVIIAFGLSAKVGGTPGPYEVFKPVRSATFKREISANTGENNKVSETWSFKSDEDNIDLEIEYTRGIPARANDAITTAYSLKNPDFYRVYHADQGVNVLQNDAILKKEYSLTGPKLGQIFDGSEKLMNIVSQPWTVRKVYTNRQNNKT